MKLFSCLLLALAVVRGAGAVCSGGAVEVRGTITSVSGSPWSGSVSLRLGGGFSGAVPGSVAYSIDVAGGVLDGCVLAGSYDVRYTPATTPLGSVPLVWTVPSGGGPYDVGVLQSDGPLMLSSAGIAPSRISGAGASSGQALVWNGFAFVPETVSGSGTAFPSGTGLVAVVSGAPRAVTAAGDGTLNPSTGALSVSKTGGVAFAPSATVDATNAGNIGSGTLAHARLPALLSADIPNNAANTTGNAGTSSALAAAPALCPAGQGAQGVLANGNATGCFVPSSGSGSATRRGSVQFVTQGFNGFGFGAYPNFAFVTSNISVAGLFGTLTEIAFPSSGSPAVAWNFVWPADFDPTQHVDVTIGLGDGSYTGGPVRFDASFSCVSPGAAMSAANPFGTVSASSIADLTAFFTLSNIVIASVDVSTVSCAPDQLGSLKIVRDTSVSGPGSVAVFRCSLTYGRIL